MAEVVLLGEKRNPLEDGRGEGGGGTGTSVVANPLIVVVIYSLP